MGSIDMDGVILSRHDVVVLGKRVSWEDFYLILEALPAAANKHMKWFSIMGPPSACGQAREEAEKIIKALFPTEARLDF